MVQSISFVLQIIRVLCSEQQCGLQPALEGGAAAFVIDGEDAPLGSAPWQAQVNNTLCPYSEVLLTISSER